MSRAPSLLPAGAVKRDMYHGLYAIHRAAAFLTNTIFRSDDSTCNTNCRLVPADIGYIEPGREDQLCACAG